MQETQVQSLGQEYLLEKEMATHSSFLAWRILWIEVPGGPKTMCHKDSDVTQRLTLFSCYCWLLNHAGLGVPTLSRVENPHVILELVLSIHISPSTSSTNHSLDSTMVLYRKNLGISGPAQFKLMLFKGHLCFLFLEWAFHILCLGNFLLIMQVPIQMSIPVWGLLQTPPLCQQPGKTNFTLCYVLQQITHSSKQIAMISPHP